MPANLYPCSQQRLYTIATLVLNNCEKHLTEFQDFSPRYTLDYINERRNEIEAVQNLHSASVRRAHIQSHRISLKKANKQCLAMLQRLKRYITLAFPGPSRKPHLESAGWLHYAQATNYKWISTRAMMLMSVTFMENHLDTLCADLNMPSNFPAQFQQAFDEFNIHHENLLTARKKNPGKTAKLVNLNNQIYRKLMNLCGDAQNIFRNQDAVLKSFTFKDLQVLTGGAGTAGIRGIITRADNHRPIENAVVSVPDTNYTATTDKKGRYKISPMASGNYVLHISAPGFEPLTIPDHHVLIGTISSRHLQLSPASIPV
ncbi:MAG: carboxypeptidase regulatory-like domain-containing protein [Chitinophagaceae bacterium]|nr:carboxypeptidase regulatory-like domain-containing protein [Chitinophagaceae bacterium]